MADPYRNFQFEVEVLGLIRAGFQKISGLKRTTDVTEYREGGDNVTPRKLPGQTKFENLTMERGVSWDSDFNNWRLQIFRLDGVGGANPPTNAFRRKMVIYLKNKSGLRVKKWIVRKAWPCEDSIGDLDASSSDVLINQMVICHEGYDEVTLPAALADQAEALAASGGLIA